MWFCSPRKWSEQILLFLGPRFEKIFGSELLVLGVSALSVLSGAVLPRFCFIAWFCSASCLKKFLLFLGPRFEKDFRERTFGTWRLYSVGASWSCFA